MTCKLEVDLYVDRARDVLSIGFAVVPDGAGPARRPRLRAVQVRQLMPGLVAQFDDGGRLVGLDLHQASRLLGAAGFEGVAVSVRTDLGAPEAGGRA